MPEADGSAPIEWGGERWELLPDRAVWWPRRQMLIIADLHLGKAAAFRAAGVPVPEVVDAELVRLERLLERTGAARLMIVGDLIHAPAGRTAAVLDAVAAWRSARSGVLMTLVRGNHDVRAGDPPGSWRMTCQDGPYVPFDDAEIAFVHDPDTETCAGRRCIGGHLHPCIVLDDGVTGLRAPCFWVRPSSLILPAFGRFTGARAVRAESADRVFAIGHGEVVEAARRPIRARLA